ncbi:protein of unknown function [Candidatus Nitrosotalea okcheonensis]|uniref:Uncharacterized protein n=1 Tax=Candidatus Nitrosotalea okcheonensis TaxID=1903276 RepID=A0A2H1FHM1_9ARCH|nr:protein of unknown function [Candidatus Nitrosotalea okcheonensis]
MVDNDALHSCVLMLFIVCLSPVNSTEPIIAKYKAQNFILLSMNQEKIPVAEHRKTARAADSKFL